RRAAMSASWRTLGRAVCLTFLPMVY
ncbi:potassium transporter Kup, partial [Achromobacter xylosoxidans]